MSLSVRLWVRDLKARNFKDSTPEEVLASIMCKVGEQGAIIVNDLLLEEVRWKRARELRKTPEKIWLTKPPASDREYTPSFKECVFIKNGSIWYPVVDAPPSLTKLIPNSLMDLINKLPSIKDYTYEKASSTFRK